MQPPCQSEIAVDLDDITTISVYERARRLLRLGEWAEQEATVAFKPIVNAVKKPQRDPTAVSEQAVAQAVLYRKKYWDC
jgi:hypothetical protein